MLDVGFSAEEVEKIEPLLVTYNNGQIEGVKYGQITTVLVNAVKQQQEIINAQQQRVKQQEERFKTQQRQIDAQQRTLASQQHEIERLKNLFASRLAASRRFKKRK